MKIRLMVSSLIFLFGWIPLLAQPDSTAATAQGTPVNMGWLIVRTIFSLLIILALIIGIVIVFKKFWGGKIPGSGNSQWIQVVARTPLGPKQNLTLIKIFDRVVLLGVSDGSIQALTEFPPESKAHQLIEQKIQASPGTSGSGFWNILKNKIES